MWARYGRAPHVPHVFTACLSLSRCWPVFFPCFGSANMSFRKPSEVLSSLSSTLPLESFANLIQKYLCPGLDNLSEPERLHIFKVLESAEKAQSEISKRIEAIDYERQGARLEKQLRALQKHVERNWRKGYDEQVSNGQSLLRV